MSLPTCDSRDINCNLLNQAAGDYLVLIQVLQVIVLIWSTLMLVWSVGLILEGRRRQTLIQSIPIPQMMSSRQEVKFLHLMKPSVKLSDPTGVGVQDRERAFSDESSGATSTKFYSFQIKICANITLQSFLFLLMFIDPFGYSLAWGFYSSAIHYTLNYISDFCFLWTLWYLLCQWIAHNDAIICQKRWKWIFKYLWLYQLYNIALVLAIIVLMWVSSASVYIVVVQLVRYLVLFLQYLTWWFVVMWYGFATLRSVEHALDWMAENLMQVFNTMDYSKIRKTTKYVMWVSSVYTICQLGISVFAMCIDLLLYGQEFSRNYAGIAVIMRVYSPVIILVICSLFVLLLSRIICDRGLNLVRVAEQLRHWEIKSVPLLTKEQKFEMRRKSPQVLKQDDPFNESGSQSQIGRMVQKERKVSRDRRMSDTPILISS